MEAYEGVIASATGQFSDMGVNRVLMGIEASYSPLPLGLPTPASSVPRRSVSPCVRDFIMGTGDHIEVPIASSLLEALAYNSMHVEDVPKRYLSRREQAIQSYRARGETMSLSYDEVQALVDPSIAPTGAPTAGRSTSWRSPTVGIREACSSCSGCGMRRWQQDCPSTTRICLCRGGPKARLHPVRAPDLTPGRLAVRAHRCGTPHPYSRAWEDGLRPTGSLPWDTGPRRVVETDMPRIRPGDRCQHPRAGQCARRWGVVWAEDVPGRSPSLRPGGGCRRGWLDGIPSSTSPT